MTQSAEIDEVALREHLEELTLIEGVTGLVSNAHASEGATLSQDERKRVVSVSAEVADDDTTVVSGTSGGSTQAVIDQIKGLVGAGAEAILLFPPHTNRPDENVSFHEDIASSTDVPIIAFQHPVGFGVRYDTETLADIVQIDGVIAVKEAAWEVQNFEQDVRAIREAAPDTQILTGNDEYLLPCYSIGEVDGGLLGLGAAIPEQIIELFDSVDNNDVHRAQEIYHKIEPFVHTVYNP
jgi:4-hydroxy-tetrahydrodipicolinate synthase